MTEIRDDHVEWAVVDRLRQILEAPPATEFDVTQTYAIFTSLLCWVMQRIRIPKPQIKTNADVIARDVVKGLEKVMISSKPWSVHLTERIAPVGAQSINVEASRGFESHTIERLLINLRDATAHGDARKVLPFHVRLRGQRSLVGFTFLCEEYRNGKHQPSTWDGRITLLKEDMQRIGSCLARTYCDTMQGKAAESGDLRFCIDATRKVGEIAA